MRLKDEAAIPARRVRMARFGLYLWLGVAWVLGGAPVRGDLLLSDYTAARPLKIMPVGDSITDDCSINGAWRLYLQPLLEANGYVFTNVGRWTSTGSPTFTQTRHEGICGAVIAYPGAYGYHGYPTASNYALNTVADALNNCAPDLVLIDLGVNDIGQHRDPKLVATNHMAALLDLIFIRAPAAHVIVGKPTSITYALIGSPPYKNSSFGMPIFCGALQALVNARRAQGQNVYLADFFSAVDGTSMMQGDGTHPNAAGLSAMADECFFRIAALTVRTDRVVTPFVTAGSTWKYSDQGLDLGTNWAQPQYDDSAWAQGPGRLGYGALGLATTISYGPAYTNRYITTYFRRAFVAPAEVHYTNLSLRLNRADGAVVWLNGQELFRVNLPARPVSYQDLATVAVTNDLLYTAYPTNLPVTSLPAGTNVVAVELHKFSHTQSSLSFDLELFGLGEFKPRLAASLSGENLTLRWPAANNEAFILETCAGLPPTGVWQTIAGPYPLTNGCFEVSVSAAGLPQFFRLRKPLP